MLTLALTRKKHIFMPTVGWFDGKKLERIYL